MRTKVIAVLLVVLTALGGLNLFQSIKDRLAGDAQAHHVTIEATENSSEQIRIKAEAVESVVAKVERIAVRAAEKAERVAVKSNSDEDVMIDRTFDVRTGQNLFVDVQHSDVEIETSNTRQARIRVMASGSNMARVREMFEEMNFDVGQSGDEVFVTSDRRNSNWNDNWSNFDVDVVISIPSEFNLNVESTHGDVELGDVMGEVTLETTHGDVAAGVIRGARLELKTTHGDIEADALESESISLQTSHADIEVGEVNSRMFSAKTSHSDIEIDAIWGESRMTTSHGDIRFRLMTNNGADLKTSHGDITVFVPSDLSARLDIQGARVSLDRNFRLNGDVEKDEIRGEINGGGNLIKARTTHGSIELRANR